MLRKVLITIFVIVGSVALYKYMQTEEARQLALIKSLTASDARVVWSEGMNYGESRHFTYWNNDHCMATIGIRGDKSYYISGSHCSDHKLTK